MLLYKIIGVITGIFLAQKVVQATSTDTRLKTFSSPGFKDTITYNATY
jgi:hypothetical protein